MDYLPPWLFTNGTLIAVFIVLWLVVSAAKKRSLGALDNRLKPEAAARGWTVQTELQGNARVIRWEGQDDGIRWLAEDIHRTRGRHQHSAVSTTRWQTVDLRVVTAGAVFLMGMPDGAAVPKAAPTGEGLLASLALKAVTFALDKSMDFHFGKTIGDQVDAATLKRVEHVEPLLPGFAVMAEHPAEAATMITNGVVQAVLATITNGPESMQGHHRPWILIWKDGVVVSRTGEAASAAGIEPVVHAGLAVARAVRF